MKYILTVLLLLMSNTARAVKPSSFSELCVKHYARRYGVSPEFIAALIDVESNWNHLAVSSKGAMGLMQLMPKTAVRFGASSPLDIEQNIAAGTRYVTTLMWEFHGDLRLVAAAYFAGDLWVGKRRLDYTNPEVIAYVREVRGDTSPANPMKQIVTGRETPDEIPLDRSTCHPDAAGGQGC